MVQHEETGGKPTTVAIGHGRDCALTTGAMQDRQPAARPRESPGPCQGNPHEPMIPAHVPDEPPLTYADSFDIPVLFRNGPADKPKRS